MTGEETRQHWTSILASRLPAENFVASRNRVSSGTYAYWYRYDPFLFRWAGVAAFASHRIGLALAPYEFAIDSGVPIEGGDPAADKFLHDLNALRIANNVFFLDVGWAHLAYISPGGGIQAVERGLEGLPKHAKLLEGFRKIEQARQIREAHGDLRRAEALIEESVLLIELHGQENDAASFYAAIDPLFDHFMSTFTLMNFNVNSFVLQWRTLTWFKIWMYFNALPLLIRTWSLPDIARLDHRMCWIDRRVMPLWKKVEPMGEAQRSLRALVQAADGGVGQPVPAAGQTVTAGA